MWKLFSPASLVVREIHYFPNVCPSSHNLSICYFFLSQFLSFSPSSLVGLVPDTAFAKYCSVEALTHKVIQASIISASVDVAANPRKAVCVPEEYN